MSLEKIAKHLEQHGRGEDSHLVHMTTGELGALQKLAQQHGGSLSINPHTGLPEAGFLSSILPTLAGVAGAAFGINPMMTAGLVGVAEGAMTHSLKNGLIAGLGAWGGSSLYGNLAGAGASAAGEAAGAGGEFTAQNYPNLSQPQLAAYQSAMPNAADPAELMQSASTANSAIGSAPSQGGMFDKATNFIKQNPITSGAIGLTALGALSKAPQTTIPGTTEQVNPFGLKTISPNFKGQTASPPAPYVPQYANYVQHPYNPMQAAEGGVMHMAGGGDQYSSELMQGLEAITKRRNVQAPAASSDHVYTDTDPSTRDLDAYNAAIKRMQILNANAHLPTTKSGLAAVNPLGTLNTNPQLAAAKAAVADIASNSPEPVTAKEGGLQGHHEHKYNLGGYSDGGRLLKGPGDGVSDGIPATIGDKQPARLADGEFVIPARIVSELGNGSTDAGAKRLYAMMDRIKDARAKAKDIAADTKAYKYLPA